LQTVSLTLHAIKAGLPPPPKQKTKQTNKKKPRKALKHEIPARVKKFPTGRQHSHPHLQVVESRRNSELDSQNTERISGDCAGW